jgi:hypothetical protein
LAIQLAFFGKIQKLSFALSSLKYWGDLKQREDSFRKELCPIAFPSRALNATAEKEND